jgi:hypothetical protein
MEAKSRFSCKHTHKIQKSKYKTIKKKKKKRKKKKREEEDKTEGKYYNYNTLVQL